MRLAKCFQPQMCQCHFISLPNMTYITKLGAYPCFQASGRRIQHFPFNNADQPVCFDAFSDPLVTNKSFKSGRTNC